MADCQTEIVSLASELLNILSKNFQTLFSSFQLTKKVKEKLSHISD